MKCKTSSKPSIFSSGGLPPAMPLWILPVVMVTLDWNVVSQSSGWIQQKNSIVNAAKTHEQIRIKFDSSQCLGTNVDCWSCRIQHGESWNWTSGCVFESTLGFWRWKKKFSHGNHLRDFVELSHVVMFHRGFWNWAFDSGTHPCVTQVNLCHECGSSMEKKIQFSFYFRVAINKAIML